MENLEYNAAYKKWFEDYSQRYKEHANVGSTNWSKIENLIIFPITGIVAYVFSQIPNYVNIIYFIIVLLIVSTPLIASGIGFLKIHQYTNQVMKHMRKQFQTTQPLPIPSTVSAYTKKMEIIQGWVIFTLLSILPSISIATMIKFDKICFAINTSITLLVLYLVLCVIFIYQLYKAK